MTNLEAFDRIKAKALAEFAEEQEEFAQNEGRGKRNGEIDTLMTEVLAATTIGDVLRVMIKRTEATTMRFGENEPILSTVPNSADHESVYLFILRAMGVESLTSQDIQPDAEEFSGEDGDLVIVNK